MDSKIAKADAKHQKLHSEKRKKDNSERKVGNEIFDKLTLETLYKLANQGYIDILNGAISTGKEANVLTGIDKNENFLAVKIYRIATSDFKKMDYYLKGDPRFNIKTKNKKKIIYSWVSAAFRTVAFPVEFIAQFHQLPQGPRFFLSPHGDRQGRIAAARIVCAYGNFAVQGGALAGHAQGKGCLARIFRSALFVRVVPPPHFLCRHNDRLPEGRRKITDLEVTEGVFADLAQQFLQSASIALAEISVHGLFEVYLPVPVQPVDDGRAQ